MYHVPTVFYAFFTPTVFYAVFMILRFVVCR